MQAANAAKANAIASDSARLPEPESRAAVILGNDAILAARPRSPAQLAHACRAAGFDIVVPPSWGDELVAGGYLERLSALAAPVVVACACERALALVAERQTDAVGEISIAGPPIMAARYLRLTYGESILVTYVGDCPSADDPAINARFSPAGFFASLERQGIAIDAQPDEMPEPEADRWRRYRSMPGGLPALRWLARAPVDRLLREATADSLNAWTSRASRSKVLLDLTDSVGCACGAHRAQVQDGEPARSTIPILVAPVGLDLAHRTSQPASSQSVVEAAPLNAVPAEIIDPAPLTTAIAAKPERVQTAQRPHVAPAPSRPRPITIPRAAESRRVAIVRPARSNRGVLLAALPALVLAVAAALGAGTYVLASDNRARATAMGEPTPPDNSAPEHGDSIATQSPAVPATTAGTIATGPARVDTSRARAGSADSTSPPADSTRVAASRRVRRARPSEIVPGWMPQGGKAWTPTDTSRTARPDSTVPRARRDTVPPA